MTTWQPRVVDPSVPYADQAAKMLALAGYDKPTGEQLHALAAFLVHCDGGQLPEPAARTDGVGRAPRSHTDSAIPGSESIPYHPDSDGTGG